MCYFIIILYLVWLPKGAEMHHDKTLEKAKKEVCKLYNGAKEGGD